jgi:hypothetical protein
VMKDYAECGQSPKRRFPAAIDQSWGTEFENQPTSG